MAKERIQRDLIDHEDLSTQMRVDIDEDLIARYTRDMRTGEKFDTIEVMPKKDGTGTYWVTDGHHRIRADIKKRPKAKTIDVIILNVPEGLSPHKAAIREALQANLKHGLPLNNADKRNKCIVAWTIDEDSWELTDRDVGRLVGVDHHTAGSVRRELVRNKTIPIRNGHLEGQFKPDWLPGAYTVQSRIDEDFYNNNENQNVDEDRVFALAQGAALICDGDRDAWSFKGDDEVISHQSIEPGKTYWIELSKNIGYQGKKPPIMTLVYEMGEGPDRDEQQKKELYQTINASGVGAFKETLREILEGNMSETHMEAFKDALEWVERANEEPVYSESDF